MSESDPPGPDQYIHDGLRAYDASKVIADEAIPFEQALSEIERARRCPMRLSFCVDRPVWMAGFE